MNHYRRYTETHSARTAHLSLIEEGAYNRLLDWQYSNEAPLPPTFEELHRITRATTAPERRATDKIATRFFTDEGWNPRAREEIEPSRTRIQAERNPARSSEPLVIPQDDGTTDLVSLLRSRPAAPAAQEPEPAETQPAEIPTEDIESRALSFFTDRRVPLDPARSFLHSMRRNLGDRVTMELLQACDQECTGEPRIWLQRAMNARKNGGPTCTPPPR